MCLFTGHCCGNYKIKDGCNLGTIASRNENSTAARVICQSCSNCNCLGSKYLTCREEIWRFKENVRYLRIYVENEVTNYWSAVFAHKWARISEKSR